MSDVVKNDVVKKVVYDKLVTKVNNIDTSEFVLKRQSRQIKRQSRIKKKNPNVAEKTRKQNSLN